MHQTLELLFESVTEQVILGIAGKDPGHDDTNLVAHALIRPHVTLLAAPAPLLAEYWERIEAILANHLPFTIELSHFGIFPGPTKTLFLGITPSLALLELHRQLFEAVQRDEQVFPYYRSENLVFHCTLREGVKTSTLVETLDHAVAPGHGTISTARLMEYSPQPAIIKTTTPAQT
jgi:2'-5' RNA ligase